MRLGVNVDHIATVRQARLGNFPDPVKGALLAEEAGADSIVCHLREDRRHIQDNDVYELRQSLKTMLNLEMSIAEDVVRVALDVKPDQVTLVPEKRQELTTEGGLDVVGQSDALNRVVDSFQEAAIPVSLFIDPSQRSIDATKALGVSIIELHTGTFAEDPSKENLEALVESACYAKSIGLTVAAGHGLDYENVAPVVMIREMEELNIGFSIIARSLFVGIELAVKEMISAMAVSQNSSKVTV